MHPMQEAKFRQVFYLRTTQLCDTTKRIPIEQLLSSALRGISGWKGCRIVCYESACEISRRNDHAVLAKKAKCITFF